MLIEDFIARWVHTEAAERANKDSFLKELCRALQVAEPDGKTGDPEQDTYVFEADAALYDAGARKTIGRMDLYKKDHFILEAKQFRTGRGKRTGPARRGTPGWALAMEAARGQALLYARSAETPPPFLIVADLGYCFDLYACFDGSGAYRPYPNNQKNRLFFKDLAKHTDALRTIWLDPHSLDPSKRSAKVTVDVAERLAELAADLEATGHPSDQVGRFLMRCVFCMFAEDINLLRDKVFTKALEQQWVPEPSSFKEGIEALWDAMNEGKRFFILGKLLHFNGGLFSQPQALDLNEKQLRILLKAAKHEWSEVEPAIFGTLIERALDPKERHRLGAHFTPTEYVQRLLVPTIEEPLRAEWDMVRVQVRELVPPGEDARPGNVKKAQQHVAAFHKKLCKTVVLDPACGSGNFLYVAMNLFKRLESEVLAMLYDLGVNQMQLGEDELVTPRQFKGLEIRAESKEIAELVLWIGYLQWHHKMYGQTKSPPEPILRDYRNIECRDALLAYSSLDAPVPADWPSADFVVGNPPFLGKLHFLDQLGEDYVAALREAYSGMVPEGADLVLYWWTKAAALVRNNKIRRFGFVSTSTITQPMNRRVIRDALAGPSESFDLRLFFAIPDHPWTTRGDAADVRIAMTGVDRSVGDGLLCRVVREVWGEGGVAELTFEESFGAISSDLRLGADVNSARPLMANSGLSGTGLLPGSRGFVLRDQEARDLLQRDRVASKLLSPLRNGKDLTGRCRNQWVIDTHGWSERRLQSEAPHIYQRLRDTVYVDRQKNRDPRLRKNWWLFRRSSEQVRAAVDGLHRFIVTPETARRRFFTFLPSDVKPEHKLVVVASDDAAVLGVLSSRVHVHWALVAGGRRGVGNDPVYSKTTCFEPFPFPVMSEEQREAIANIAERIECHRHDRVAEHPKLRLTEVYRVLEKLRAGVNLDDKDDREVYDLGLVSVLQALHDDLDAAVFAAYGWSSDLQDDEILERLVALNEERAAEEAAGVIRWLRPERRFGGVTSGARIKTNNVPAQLEIPWPKDLPQQVAAVRDFIVANDAAFSAAEIAKAYKGASTTSVVPALETLEALGMAARFDSEKPRWKGLARTTGERTIGPGGRRISTSPPSKEAAGS